MMQLIFAVFFLVLALKIVGLLLKICGKAVGIILGGPAIRRDRNRN